MAEKKKAKEAPVLTPEQQKEQARAEKRKLFLKKYKLGSKPE